MKTSGLLMLITTWAIILTMFTFSFVKILREHDKENDDKSDRND